MAGEQRQSINNESVINCEDLNKNVQGEDRNTEDICKLSDTIFLYHHIPLTNHGNVYHGVIKSPVYGERTCAIKYARKSEYNVREAKFLNKLGFHTHVISLIQSGVDQTSLIEQVYLVLESCNKLNFRQYLMKHKEKVPIFDANWGFQYCKQIIAGMIYVHEKLIIHKDLKPSNILLSHDFSIIKIADFGSSVEVKSPTSMIWFESMSGTFGYRSPEGFGKSYGSLKTDSYSLGILLYFILSYGETPLGDDSAKWDINTKKGVIDLSKLLVSNPHTTQHLISLMMRHNRRHRPSIWRIGDHPCWTGKEDVCDFDYGSEEEVPDDEYSDHNEITPVSSDDLEDSRKLAEYIDKNGHIFGTLKNEEEKTVEDHTSKNPSIFYDSSFATHAKIIQEDSFEFMTERHSKEVGPEGATITVGGCSISFPEGCFDEKEKVLVGAKIDSTIFPPGREAVTPILQVIVENMKKPALVSLMTWCAKDPNNDVYVAIVRLDESWGGWKVIHRCKLLNSGFIEFECDGFSNVVGVVENENVPSTYLLQPVICTVKRTCYIALLKCEKLEMKHFLSTACLDTFLEMTEEDHHSKFRNLQLTFNKISCKRGDEVKCGIVLKSNEESLKFNPKELFFDINDITENDKPTYNSCLIEGKITESPVKIIFFLIKNGEFKQNRVVDLHMEVDAETALAVAPN